MGRTIRLSVALLFVVAERTAAQRIVSSVDLAGSGLRYADTIGVAAVTVSPGVQVNSDRATLGASASYSKLAAGGWTMQGGLAGSGFTAPAGSLLGELAFSAGGSANESRSTSGQALALARAHVMGAKRGAWLGGGGGRTWDGSARRNLAMAEAGLWSHPVASTMIIGTLSPTRIGDSIRYADAEVGARVRASRTEFTMSAGSRLGGPANSTRAGARTWGSVNITTWVASTAAIVAAGGVYPPDLSQGFPGGRFVSLGMRVRTAPGLEKADAIWRARRATPIDEPAPLVERVEVATLPSGDRIVRVRSVTARTLEIRGDLTKWSSIALAKGDSGSWSVTLPIPSGVHQINVRVNGGPWLVPAGLAVLRDEFGGEAGLLVVP